MAGKKSYEDGSMMDLAVKGLSQITGLLKDERPVGRLLALNSILVFLILGLDIASYLNVKFDDFSGIIILLIAFLFSAIISGAYIFFIKSISKASKAVRYSIFILFLAIPLSVFGLVYQLKNFVNATLFLILIQGLAMIILSLFVKEEQITEEKSNFWNVLGKANTLLGIVSSLVSISGLIFKFLR